MAGQEQSGSNCLHASMLLSCGFGVQLCFASGSLQRLRGRGIPTAPSVTVMNLG